MHLTGTPQAVATMEAILRSGGSLAQVPKKKNTMHGWLYDTPRDVDVRTYEVPIAINGHTEMYKVKFVLDKRADFNKIDLIGQSVMEAIFNCVPDASQGLSELMVGELIASKVEVVRLGQKNGYELATKMVCPFCQEREVHQCKEPDEQRNSDTHNISGDDGVK
jgi:flavin-binding protein dodecin